ncbi:hypothetical protein Dimus_021334 [Dionaea muscipula]
MSKEFNVPPVIFPAGGNPVPTPQQRRTPVPPLAGNPSIPFLSFDIAAATAPSTTTTLPYSAPRFIGAGGSLNFGDEPPLLEELGINTKQIWSKTISVLNPIRIKPNLHEDADLSGGPVIFGFAGIFAIWSTRVCTKLLVEISAIGDEHSGLIAYACFLIYALFSLLIIF